MPDELEALWKEIRSLRGRLAHLEAVGYGGLGAAGDADTVDGFHAAAAPAANKLLALNGDAKFPADIIQSVSVRVYRSIGQTIPNGEWTAIAFNTQRWDDPNDDQWEGVTNPTRLTCRYAGPYVISANLRWTANNVGERMVRIFLNGTTYIAFIVADPVSASITVQSVTASYKLSVGDFVELGVYQNSGGGIDVDSSAGYSPEFSMVGVA